MASHPSRRGSNFCRFFGLGRRKNNDILGIYFVRNNCVFSDAPEPVQNQIPKKITFLGNFLAYIFHHISFSRLCLYTVLSGWSTKKWRFFAWDNTVLFGSSTLIAETDIISLRQLFELRISKSQHIQTCQFKTTNVKIHPPVPKVYTHLISFGQMEMTNASGNFGNTLVGLRAWNDTIHDFRKKNNVFSGICKNAVFSGHGSRMTVRKNIGYLAGWLSGWLAAYLAGWLSLTRWLDWLADWHWLSGWLSEWLALWLAICLAI